MGNDTREERKESSEKMVDGSPTMVPARQSRESVALCINLPMKKMEAFREWPGWGVACPVADELLSAPVSQSPLSSRRLVNIPGEAMAMDKSNVIGVPCATMSWNSRRQGGDCEAACRQEASVTNENGWPVQRMCLFCGTDSMQGQPARWRAWRALGGLRATPHFWKRKNPNY